MNKKLEKMLTLTKKEAELRAKIEASQDLAEVRSLGDELNKVIEDLTKIKEEYAKEEAPAEDAAPAEEAPAEGRSFNPMASYSTRSVEKRESEDVLDSMEYRKAFANYVRTGNFNMEKRADEVLTTAEIGKIIPNTIMNEFIKELKSYGQLYSRVRKLNVKGGVEFPIEDLIPTVTWITETTVSETQAAPNFKNSISFGYHIVEARISQSLLSQVVSLPVLESEIAKILAEAFVKEFDRVIVSGTGSGQPLGILNDTRIPAAQKIAFTSTEIAEWTNYRKKLFAKIPLAYRGEGIFLTTAANWEGHIMTLKDTNGRPLYSETYDPVTGNEICRFAGREVVLVEPDILKDYDTATTGDAWAIYLKPTNYAINSNMQIGFKRWFDDDKNKWVNKGLAIMDGKLLDVNGVYILTK